MKLISGISSISANMLPTQRKFFEAPVKRRAVVRRSSGYSSYLASVRQIMEVLRGTRQAKL